MQIFFLPSTVLVLIFQCTPTTHTGCWLVITRTALLKFNSSPLKSDHPFLGANRMLNFTGEVNPQKFNRKIPKNGPIYIKPEATFSFRAHHFGARLPPLVDSRVCTCFFSVRESPGPYSIQAAQCHPQHPAHWSSLSPFEGPQKKDFFCEKKKPESNLDENKFPKFMGNF